MSTKIRLSDMPPDVLSLYLAITGSVKKLRPTLEYPDNPVGFMRNVLGWEPWSFQRDILEAIAVERHVYVKKCHSSGGTALMARVALWFLHRYLKESCAVLTTAPTGRQVKELLWREMRVAYRRSLTPLQGRMYETPYYTVKDDIYAIGFSADSPESVPGFHADHVLVLIDEAAGIDQEIRTALLSATAGGDARVVEMSQPLQASGAFYEAFTLYRDRYEGSLFTIPYYMTPNFRDDEPDINGLIGRAYVDETRLANGGEDNDVFRVRCLADFPKNDASAVIPLAWVEAAVQRWRDHAPMADQETTTTDHSNGHSTNGSSDSSSDNSIFAAIAADSRAMAVNNDDDDSDPEREHVLVIGADIASGGADKTVFARRIGKNGKRVLPLLKYDEADTMNTAARLTAIIRKHGCKANVDVIGVGTGVFNRLRDEEHADIRELVCAFNAAESTEEWDLSGQWQFVNVRSAAWWHMRELLDPENHEEIELPPDPYLIADLTAPVWMIAGQKYRVESKDKIKERLGRSTDEGDAVVMSFYKVDAAVSAPAINMTRRSPYRM